MNMAVRTEEDRQVGVRVKALRQKHRISISELAHNIEMDPSALNLAEAGLTHFSAATIYRIACVLGVNILELLTEADSKNSNEIESLQTEICATTMSFTTIDKLNPLLELARQMKGAD